MLEKLNMWMALAVMATVVASPAHALTMAECSAKYQAAKDAGTLKGMKWNDFRKAECGSDASEAAKPAKTKAPEDASDDGAKGLTMAECSAKYQAAKDADTLKGMKWNDFRKAECGPGASAAGAAAKPAKTKAPEDASDDGAKGLTMAECSAKYQAAKDAGTLKGMKWNDFRKAECGPGASAAGAAAKPVKTKAPEDAKDDGAKGLTMAECSAKYQAAKDADTLKGMKWNDFRKAECGPGASAASAAAKPAKTKAPEDASDDGAKGLTMAECSAKYQAAKDADTLKGMKWNDFRKAECGPGASAASAAAKPAKTKAPEDAKDDGVKGLTMAECSTKYQAAKEAGTLKGMKWNDFRKAECGPGAADDDSVPNLNEANYSGDPETPTATAPQGVKFPTAVSKKFSNETPGKARLHTCLEEYYANKDAGLLNGLRWIQKGGGYYSLCNAKLKS